MAAERVRAQIVHETGHRVRLRASALRGKEEACRNLEIALRAVPDVGLVEVKAMTGSIILASEAGRAAILKSIKPLIEVRKLAARPPQPQRPIERAAGYVDKLQKDLMKASGGRLNMEDAAFVLFCVGAVVQLARGRFASPATALLVTAFSLATGSQRRPAVD